MKCDGEGSRRIHKEKHPFGCFFDGIVRPAIFSTIYECAKLKLVDFIDFLFVTYYNNGVVYAKFEQICLMARRESQR
jgi:hypothetical protein